MKKTIFIMILSLMSFLKTYSKNIDKQLEVANIIKEMDIPHPTIVMKQIILESGHLTSNASINRNNILGLFGGYKYYNNYRECLADYKKHISSKYKGGNYYTFLEKLGYCECDNYVLKLKEIKLKPLVTEALLNKKNTENLWERFYFNFNDLK